MAEIEGKTIHSVEKAIRILDVLAAEKKPIALTELYRQLGWPKSTIHGLLSTMRASGLIEQGDDGRYWLGLRLFEYGCAVSNAWDIAAIARPFMQQVSASLHESVFLSVLDRAAVVTLAEVESPDCLRVVSEVGARLPIHCTSQGKLFLAYVSQAEQRRILRTAAMESFTANTVTDPERLSAEISLIRDKGYAVENGEFKHGLRSVSVPVCNAHGDVAYAVGCVGLLPQAHFAQAVEQLRHAARQIANAIGWRG